MSHNHHHHHDHDHDHHDHDHDHHHEPQSPLSFDQKLAKLLDHWIKHNDDHAENYRDWAAKAKENNMPAVSALLEDAAEITLTISRKFEEAGKVVKGG